MTIQQSNILKGIGILMMLYVHLFHSVENIPTECIGIYYGHTPLIQKLSRLAAPVPLFLMISGYGLMCKYQKGTLSPKECAKKIPVLYSPYILITLAFMTIGTFVTGTNFFENAEIIIDNITGWKPTFNMNAWFLLPYIVLLLTSHFICRFVCQTPLWKVLVLGLVCHVAESVYNDHAPEAISSIHPLTFCFWYIKLLFAFMLGCLLRLQPTIKFMTKLNSQAKVLLLLVALCFIKLHLPGIWDVVFIFAFISLFNRLSLPDIARKPLTFLGKHSMNMWFIHGWLMGTIINIYELNLPIIIYIALATLSLLVSITTNLLLKGGAVFIRKV